jgi:hypothetical protein
MLNAARGKDRPQPVVGLVVGHRWENWTGGNAMGIPWKHNLQFRS